MARSTLRQFMIARAKRASVLLVAVSLGSLGSGVAACKGESAASSEGAAGNGAKAYISRKTAADGDPAVVGAPPTPKGSANSGESTATTLAGDTLPSSTSPAAAEHKGNPGTTPAGPSALRMQITVVDGAGLPDLDDGPGVTDAYVVIEYDGERHQTSVSSGLDPTWGDSFAFDVQPGATLRVSLMDQDTLSDEKVGVTTLSVPTIRSGEQKMLDVPFGGGDNGKVRLKLLGL